MQLGSIPYKWSVIHYCFCGKGDNLLLCFHGYGESKQSFYFLQKKLPPGYQLLAIDLPFHGETDWKEGLSFTAEDLFYILGAICSTNGISIKSITMLGFSMGGRVALSLVPSIAANIKKIVLLAPDGLKINFWYWLATQNRPGNRFFKFTMKHPQWFFLLLKAGNVVKIVNQSVYKFIRHYLHDNMVRQQLYQRWTAMRELKPSLPEVKSLIRQNNIHVHLVYGQYDRIIRHERGEKFRKGIESFCTLHIIPTGHQVLHEKNTDLIIQLIQSYI